MDHKQEWRLERTRKGIDPYRKEPMPLEYDTHEINCLVKVSKLTAYEDYHFVFDAADNLSTEHVDIQWVASEALETRQRLQNHDYFELCLVAESVCNATIEDRICTFQPGDLFLLNCNIRNAFPYAPGSTLYYLAISKNLLLSWPNSFELRSGKPSVVTSFFKKNLASKDNSLLNYLEFSHLSEASLPIAKGLFEELYTLLDGRKPGYSFHVYGKITELFAALEDPCQYKCTFYSLDSHRDKRLIQKAKEYLAKNPRRVTVRELAQQLHYNEIYLSRIFKTYTGESLKTYNQRVYMNEAIRLLSSSAISISEIAKRLGFANRTQFYTLFNEHFHCTPQEYRSGTVERQDG